MTKMTGMGSTSGYHAENLSIVNKFNIISLSLFRVDVPGSHSLPAGNSPCHSSLPQPDRAPCLSKNFEEESSALKIQEDSEDLCR